MCGLCRLEIEGGFTLGGDVVRIYGCLVWAVGWVGLGWAYEYD